MKTLMLRVCYLGLAVSTIIASPGTEEPADTTDPVADVLAPLKIADADALAESQAPAPLALAAAGDTNAPPQTNAPAKVVPVQEPVAPPNVKLSPAMADVVKLIQAGVSPDVMMAYITNSASVFNVDSDVIVYLNDLGVTNTVITALIQHDSSPETAARRASAIATQPLPPGIAATAPVTNVYPTAAKTAFPPAGQTAYPGDFSSVTDTNDTNLPPAVANATPAEAAPVVTAPLASENVSVNYFYSSLSPYGTWVDVDGYGLCWRPTVAVGDPYWRPYSDRGRWLWTDCGWYWYSDYSWGWAPFHYGRWCSYPRLGWIWVPGSVWAPSWVTWRYTDAYCGWAPLPPGCGYRSGIGLTWYGSGISIGFDFGLGSHCWSYVPVGRFCDWNVRRHCLPANRLHVVHRTATPVNRFTARNSAVVNHGVEPNTIAKAARTKIPTLKVKDHALPADSRVRPERLDSRDNTIAVTRQLPKLQPASATPVSSRGAAPRVKPANLANTPQTVTPAPANITRPNTTAPAPNTAATPRVNGNNNHPSANPVVRSHGNQKQQPNTVSTPPPNSNSRAEKPPVVKNEAPKAAPTPPANRQHVATPNVQRQAPPGAIARNNVTPAPAPNAAPGPRNVAPRSQPTPSQAAPAPRQAPPQTAPAPRNNNPMIRSYAEPQRSVPSVSAPRAAQPSFRSQAPMATPPVSRPQVSAPRMESPRPSYSAPSAPSARSAPPSVSRSAPSSSGGGGGGGGGNRGGGNSGNSGNGSGRNRGN